MIITKALFFIFIASCFSTAGNIFVKKSRQIESLFLPESLSFINSLFILAIFCYCMNLYFFMRSLEFFPVSIGYPILASLGFIFLAISAWFYLGETLGPIQISGMVTIVIGIFMLLSGFKTL